MSVKQEKIEGEKTREDERKVSVEGRGKKRFGAYLSKERVPEAAVS